MIDSKNRRMYFFLVLLTIACYTGFQGWRTLFNNFAVETVGVDGLWIGIIQSVREIPGFLALLVVYVLAVLNEHRVASISVLIMGVGIASVGFLPTNWGLIVSTFVMSVGFHYFETTNQSLTLQYFPKSKSPKVLASFKSFAAVTNISIGLIILLAAKFLEMKQLFLLIGSAVMLMALVSFFLDPHDEELASQNKKMVIKKKYWLFYALNFLAGARRQIFIVFAVFLLVKKYGYSVQTVAILFVINNILNFFMAPLIGKAISHFGERKVLTVEYFFLVIIFASYALIENPHVVAVLYVLDHVFFNFAIGINTFFQKTGDKEDIAPSMAVGFTINHITAVFIPFIGGYIWMINWKLPFLFGAGLSLISLIFVQMITIPKHSEA